MKLGTREWVVKAEADLVTACRELRARRSPNFDAACFHAQQCVEKYLKAPLVEAGLPFPRTHDLEALLDLILPRQPLWESFRARMNDLSSFAVVFRYPGESATHAMARTSVNGAREIRRRMREDMGLPVK